MKHIDNLFKEKLYNQEVPVPEGMWEKIAPIAEEESGRAMLWFWLAGILALAIGGYGIYKMIDSSVATEPDPSTLVYQDHQTPLPSNLTDQSLAQSIEVSFTDKEDKIAPVNQKINTTQSSKIKKQSATVNLQSFGKDQININNTIERIPDVVGKPANLVITKSYVNEEGSVIKQSNLQAGSSLKDPVYDVIINSGAKDINAGALLRIVEPLENIPLPSFQNQLKKKKLSLSF